MMPCPATRARIGHRLAVVPMLLALCAPLAAAPAGVQVLQAEVGLFGPREELGRQSFQPGRHLPLRDGQEFGWRIVVKTNKPFVRVREELTLPAEPRTWGDPEPDIKRRTSPDGRTAITEWRLAPVNGVLQSAWTVTTGDPPGTWVMKLQVEDQPERVFRLQAR